MYCVGRSFWLWAPAVAMLSAVLCVHIGGRCVAFMTPAILVETLFLWDCNFLCIRLRAVKLAQCLILDTCVGDTVIGMSSFVLEHCKHLHGQLCSACLCSKHGCSAKHEVPMLIGAKVASFQSSYG